MFVASFSRTTLYDMQIYGCISVPATIIYPVFWTSANLCDLLFLLCFVVGKYMQMMIVLKPIAFDVIIYMTQLFDYYLYSVNIFYVTFPPAVRCLVLLSCLKCCYNSCLHLCTSVT